MALESAMQNLEAANAQVLEAQTALYGVQQEMHKLQSAADSGGSEEPPGCNILRELRNATSSSGDSVVSSFLDAELAVILSSAKAAQGYPDWQDELSRSMNSMPTELIANEEEDDADDDLGDELA